MIQLWASDITVDMRVTEDEAFGNSARCRGCGEQLHFSRDGWEPHTVLDCLQRIADHVHEVEDR